MLSKHLLNKWIKPSSVTTKVSLGARGPHYSTPWPGSSATVSLSFFLLILPSVPVPQAILIDSCVFCVGVIPVLWGCTRAPGGFPMTRTAVQAPLSAAAGCLGCPDIGPHRHREQHSTQDHRDVQKALPFIQPTTVSTCHKDHTLALAWGLAP